MKFWISCVIFMCLLCFDCVAFLCIRTSSKSLRECLRARRFRPPHYCTPLVCVSKFSKGFAVWRPTQPKPNPETRDFVCTESHVEKVLNSFWDPVYAGSHVEKDPVYTARPCAHILRSVWDPLTQGLCWESVENRMRPCEHRVSWQERPCAHRKTLCTHVEKRVRPCVHRVSCWESVENCMRPCAHRVSWRDRTCVNRKTPCTQKDFVYTERPCVHRVLCRERPCVHKKTFCTHFEKLMRRCYTGSPMMLRKKARCCNLELFQVMVI